MKNPAALLELADRWPNDRPTDLHTDSWMLGYMRAKRDCAAELRALASPGGGVVTDEDFDRWWEMSKYTQVVYPSEIQKQVAKDGWNAAVAALERGDDK